MKTDTTVNKIFELKNIITPRIESTFVSAPTNGAFKYAFRIAVYINSDTTIQILLGTRVTSDEKYNGENPKVVCTAEILGEFSLPQPLGEVKDGNAIPNLPHMVAMLYPFVREKVYYCFSSNQYNLIMPALVIHDLVSDKIKNKGLEIADGRKKIANNTVDT